MLEVSDDAALCELRLKKRNVFKKGSDTVTKRKSDEGRTEEQQMEGVKEGLKPLIENFVERANQHL